MNRKLICIGCPMGCHLTAVVEKNEVIEVTGNTCSRGMEYARNECMNPVRMLTTTVNIREAMYPLLSVRTTKQIPKTMLKESVK
jgi:CxxC motif-containing protein